jgi:hypothetical protein
MTTRLTVQGPDLVDAHALWWHEADPCDHDPELVQCECWPEGGWDLGPYGGCFVDIDGVRYITDRHLLIREDRLTNWPQSGHPHPALVLYLNETMPRTIGTLRERLHAPYRTGPTTRTFPPDLLDPLLAAGYSIRPLDHESGVHAVVHAVDRVGLLMPLPVDKRTKPATRRNS